MKRLALYLLVIAPLFIAFVTISQPAPVFAQTKAQATKCSKDFGNNTYKATDKGWRDYLKSDCAASKGGNCTSKPLGLDGTAGPSGRNKIICTSSAGGNNNTGNNNANPDDIKDPALTRTASCNKKGCDLISKYINPVILLLTVLVGLAIVIGIIIGAIQVITAAGDSQQVASGKDHIRNAIIGAVAYAFLFAFLEWLIPGNIT